MSSRPSVRSAVLAFALSLAASPAIAQLCPGLTDPCVISSNTSVPSGTNLDIGTRGFVIGANITLTIQSAGFFNLHAGSFTMQSGAKLVALGTGGFGGILSITVSGPVTMQDASLIDVGSGNGGSIDVVSSSGNTMLLGRIQADATLREGIGGDVAFTATGGNITLGGLGINANGGDRFAGGGSVLLDASGDVLVSALVQIRGSDGGTFEAFAGGDVTVSNGTEINLRALDVEFGDGGDICLEAGNDIAFGGMLFSNASGDGPENGGGDGGFTDFIALGDIVVTGSITSQGSADGSGGDTDFDAATVTVTGPIDLTGPGQGDGGNLFVLATTSVLLNGLVDARAGLAGGSFSFGGTIDVISDADVTIGGTAQLRATGTAQAGTVDIFGCNVTIQNGAVLDSTGPATATSGTNTVQASGNASIGGVAMATTANRVNYRTFAPTIAPQAGTSPAWTTTIKPTLPCCIGCPTTTVTTTTSTSIPGTTTTTSTAPSTTATSTSTTSTSTSTTATSSSVTTSSTSVTTTTVETSTTTTTTLPGGCEGLSDFEATACELGLLSDDVAALTDDDLGGSKKARGLRKRIEKSVGFFERARLETSVKKVKRFVKRSLKKLVSFENKIVRFTEKSFISLEVAQDLLDQVAKAKADLEALEVSLDQQ